MFACEYALSSASDAYQKASAHGFIPYVTRRSLGALTTTPPPGYGVQNAAPVAVADTVETSPGASAVINVLANDSDPNGDALTLTGIVTAPSHGQAVINGTDNTVIYTPNAGFTGTDHFRYQISDGALTAQADVTVSDGTSFSIESTSITWIST